MELPVITDMNAVRLDRIGYAKSFRPILSRLMSKFLHYNYDCLGKNNFCNHFVSRLLSAISLTWPAGDNSWRTDVEYTFKGRLNDENMRDSRCLLWPNGEFFDEILTGIEL
jgi:hypothetical protein